MKKYGQFVMGLILGAILFTGITVFAEEALQIKANPFPIFVNGIKKDVEAYNINGFTFMKLADVGNVTGTSVKFNENLAQIEITVTGSVYQSSAPATPSTVKSNSAEQSNAPKNYDSDLKPESKEEYMKNGYVAIDYNGKTYMTLGSITKLTADKITLQFEKGVLSALTKDGKMLVGNVPYITINATMYFEEDYYLYLLSLVK